MSAVHSIAAVVLGGVLLVSSACGLAQPRSPLATRSTTCPPASADALRHLRLRLTHEDFRGFVIEAGAEAVNVDSLTTITDVDVCAALDAALVEISEEADPVYYQFEDNHRAYFQADHLYFTVEWVRQPDDPWQVRGGPDYYRAFGPDFRLMAQTSQ
jgi:hypothetical protein